MSIKTKHLVFIAVVFSILIGCKNEPKTCKYGTPKAIFSDSTPTVVKHLFKIKDGAGIEMVAFKNKLLLEIEQEGCNEIKQQYSFIMFGKFNDADDAVWKQVAITHFRELAKLSPELMAFNGWADAIESVKDKLKLSEPIEVEGKIQIRIDKILAAEQATLVVQMAQK